MRLGSGHGESITRGAHGFFPVSGPFKRTHENYNT